MPTPLNYVPPQPAIYIPHENAVLVIEDNQQRIAWFRSKLGPNTSYAKTPAEAVQLIGSMKFDCIFFDHDCTNEMVYDGPDCRDDLTFRAAVRKVREVYGLALPQIIIHSHNTPGALWIHQALRGHAHIWPFGKFNVERVERQLFKDQKEAKNV